MRLMLLIVVAVAQLAAVPALRADTEYEIRQRRLEQERRENEERQYQERLLKQDRQRIERTYGRHHAAIAYSPRTRNYGYASNCPTLSQAKQEALRDCNADDARIVTYASGVIGNVFDNPYPAHIVTRDGITLYTPTIVEGVAIMLGYFVLTSLLGLVLFEREEFA